MDVAGALRQLRFRVDAMVARAVISRVNDALKTQRLQLTILADEVEDDVEHMQPYGLSFTPPANAEALVLAVGGARSHTVAICAQDPGERPTGAAAGTGGLYTAGEWRLYIDAAGVVHLGAQAGAEFVALAAKTLTELNAIRARVDALTTYVDGHAHTSAASGSPTSVPAPLSLLAELGVAGSVAATKVKAT